MLTGNFLDTSQILSEKVFKNRKEGYGVGLKVIPYVTRLYERTSKSFFPWRYCARLLRYATRHKIATFSGKTLTPYKIGYKAPRRSNFFLKCLSMYDLHFIIVNFSSKFHHQGATIDQRFFKHWPVYPPRIIFILDL